VNPLLCELLLLLLRGGGVAGRAAAVVCRYLRRVESRYACRLLLQDTARAAALSGECRIRVQTLRWPRSTVPARLRAPAALRDVAPAQELPVSDRCTCSV
jgi:hypothetical protein